MNLSPVIDLSCVCLQPMQSCCKTLLLSSDESIICRCACKHIMCVTAKVLMFGMGNAMFDTLNNCACKRWCQQMLMSEDGKCPRYDHSSRKESRSSCEHWCPKDALLTLSWETSGREALMSYVLFTIPLLTDAQTRQIQGGIISCVSRSLAIIYCRKGLCQISRYVNSSES